MTDIKHHLTDSLLMAYSAGTLPEAFNLAVAAHVSLCADCRATLEGFDAVGGALLDEAREPLADDSLAKTMALIGQGAPAVRQIRVDPVLPGPVADYVGGGIEAVRWRPAGIGVRQAILPTSSSATARLLHIKAGVAVPDHGHRGTELTLVLQGAFSDEDGHFKRGDIEVATEAVEHTPIADTGDDCICLAVTDAPLRFKSLIPRLAQPLFRI
ncbi:ChrR family anti-sigma-E factor [Pseudoprimorskyibacter insulae]|uniref:Anti-sigma-E factor ChrR n=1 Tax=Pseudoprimorskyibacter insulae TaxID=1695997 RepID=A0A2R8AN70_9RHOB|nr:ChrR family anti-sigma-E factor [Pseudoprimorskyibacter insulae]SPF77498.1 Anti-sigma-E factor ChrR [Pseudoprimorskyibacter insulae]